ncbi:ImmA/IrrE family metallo-endopeptidase [Agrobacterium vitis]|uniref:ImmA/IrrE family metallo-endopeptidase n=1 Tax=Allorhizobium ampelinum TaxID=3025782 RepID=UPI001F316543|nr:ImmA/IrrE family metallo-endopeptidase [Allorhizobium ampelinum]MCF1470392.1 ImmA/IrrE family metallo-endopeptidase [Allorhizobium ampelinum]
MTKALINPAMMVWAAARSNVSADAISRKLKIDINKVESWLNGTEQPSFAQAQKLAKCLHIPFGFLYLKKPPIEGLPIPDLRTVGSDPATSLDHNFHDLLKDVMFKRDWYRDFCIEIDGDELPFVGSFNLKSPPEDVAHDIKRVLFRETEFDLKSASNWESYLSILMKKSEDAGIWVMRNGVVGSNTSRVLSVSQFRGFTISDKIVPLIFINGADAKAAQIFTLAHELAHVWLGESGISNVHIGETNYGTYRALEQKCNQIAAEFLVPTNTINERWQKTHSSEVNIDLQARYFKVSRIVIARRAYDLGIISENEYKRYYALEIKKWNLDEGSGGDFYRTLPVRNGGRFTHSVVNEAVSGRLLLRQAAALLNTQPASIIKFHSRRQAA